MTLAFEPRAQKPTLQKSRPFGGRIDNVPEYVCRILFEKKL